MKKGSSGAVTPKQYVDGYFKKTGLKSWVKPQQFWVLLKKKFGKAADEFVDCVDARERGDDVSPYELKNQSLKFANAVVSQFDAEKLKAVAIWFLQEQMALGGKKVLEIGCDNGVLLCLIAELFPDTKFLGIDPCRSAITVAKERALVLGLSNVEFRVGSAESLAESNETVDCDVIIAVTVFHEILAGGGLREAGAVIGGTDSEFSIEEVDRNFSTKIIEAASLTAVRRALAPDGVFISVDRWPDQNKLLKWVRLNEAVGLGFSLSRSYIIQCNCSSGEAEKLPLTVFSLASPIPVPAIDVLAFKSYLAFAEEKGLHQIDDELVAELLYSALDKMQFYSHEVVYKNGSGTMLTYMGVARGIGYIYSTTNRDFRQLLLMPSSVMYERVKEVIDARVAAESFATIKYEWGDRAILSRLCIDLSLLEAS